MSESRSGVTSAVIESIVKKIRPVFRIRGMGYIRDAKNRVLESHFAVFVEANVTGTDHRVLEERKEFFLCHLKVTRRCANFVLLTGSRKLGPDGEDPQWWTNPIRAYKESRTSGARAGIRKLSDRVAYVIAPHFRHQFMADQVGWDLCREVHGQLVCLSVLSS